MLQNLVVQISANTAGLNQGVSGALTQLNRLGSNAQVVGNQINRGMSSPLGSLKNLAAGFLSVSVAVGAVKEGLNIVSTMQRVDASLKAASSSSADYARSQTFLRATADQLGLSYESLADGYKNLKAATMGTALAGSETERIFTSVVHAGAALRLSNEDVQGSLRALTQMMSTGTVQSDELKNELGNRLPGALKLMSNALGVTQKELIKMLEQGQVLASDALPKLATELEKTYGAQAQANINSMAGGWTRLTDQAKLFLAEFSKENGVDKFFAKLGNSLANYIQGLREAQNRGESLWGLTKDRRVELSRQAGMRQEFVTAQPGRRQEMLDQARFELDSYRSELKNPNLNSEQRGNINAAIVQAEERLLILRRANIKVLGQEFAEQRKAEQQALSTGRVFFDLERDKKRLTDLKTIIANKRGNGQDYSAEQREFNTLSARIDKATDSVRKHSAAHVAAEPTLTTNERLLKRYSQALKEYGDTADGARSRTVALLQDAVALDKARANNKPVDIGKVNTITPAFDKTAIAQALTGTANMPKLPGLSDFQRNAEQELGGIQRLFGKFKLPGIDISLFKRSASELRQDLEQLGQNISGALQNAATGLATGLGEMIGNLLAGTAQLSDLPNMLGAVFGNLAKTMGQAMIAFGTAGIAAKAFVANPVGAIVAGIALTALGTALQVSMQNSANNTFGGKGGKLPAFAKGVTSFGTTLGVFGEYPGASRNPEFTAPVNIGANLIGDRLAKMGAFGGGMAGGEFVVRGTDLVLVLQRAGTTKLNFGS